MTHVQSVKNNLLNYLQIRFDSENFLVSSDQIEGVIEFQEINRNSGLIPYIIGTHSRKSDFIPVINVKKYLKCEFHPFKLTNQSRILLYYNSKIGLLLGVVVDAIIGYYEIKSENKWKIPLKEISNKSNCFSIEFTLQLKGKSIPQLELNKIVNEVPIEKLPKLL